MWSDAVQQVFTEDTHWVKIWLKFVVSWKICVQWLLFYILSIYFWNGNTLLQSVLFKFYVMAHPFKKFDFSYYTVWKN